jgi:hypothetical protein
LPETNHVRRHSVKVKVIDTPVLFSRVEPGDVEDKLQAWLDDNPDAGIEHVAQTPLMGGFDGETRRLLVTIFYRE